MELLRIVSMIFVVVLHANIWVMDKGIVPCLVESLAIIAVGSFIFLSGWYGIKCTVKKLCSLLFQVFFFSGLFLIAQLIVEKGNVKIGQELLEIFTLRQFWFVGAYLALFILAPVLNTFAEHASKKVFLFVIVSLFVFQTIFSYINNSLWYSDGESPLLFLLLYLCARFFRNNVKEIPGRWISVGVYLGLSLLITITAWLLMKHFGTQGRMWNYTNPLVVVSSIAFVFGFASIRLKSQIVNWIAQSVFAIYLFHMNPWFLNQYFNKSLSILAESSSLFRYYVIVSGMIIGLFIIAVLLDRIRIITWNCFSGLIWKAPGAVKNVA